MKKIYQLILTGMAAGGASGADWLRRPTEYLIDHNHN